MQKVFISFFLLICFAGPTSAQKAPTGNSADFKVKTCLHSIGYSGLWRGQAVLTVDEFLLKAKELGYEGLSKEEIRKSVLKMKPFIVKYDPR